MQQGDIVATSKSIEKLHENYILIDGTVTSVYSGDYVSIKIFLPITKKHPEYKKWKPRFNKIYHETDFRSLELTIFDIKGTPIIWHEGNLLNSLSGEFSIDEFVTYTYEDFSELHIIGDGLAINLAFSQLKITTSATSKERE